MISPMMSLELLSANFCQKQKNNLKIIHNNSPSQIVKQLLSKSAYTLVITFTWNSSNLLMIGHGGDHEVGIHFRIRLSPNPASKDWSCQKACNAKKHYGFPRDRQLRWSHFWILLQYSGTQTPLPLFDFFSSAGSNLLLAAFAISFKEKNM